MDPGHPRPSGTAPRFGVVTDVHYADKSRPEHPRKELHREALTRLENALKTFANFNISFAVELGDLVDSAPDQCLDDSEGYRACLRTETGYLRTINGVFSRVRRRHYVLGNHCVENLTKQEFLSAIKRKASYYSFDQSGVHFVVLDACFRKDHVDYGRRNSDWKESYIPPHELDWLRKDLSATRSPTMIFVHQRADTEDAYAIKNSRDVRTVLEESGRVKAVFQGHYHNGGNQKINGVHYFTFGALVDGPGENSGAHAVVEIYPTAINVIGFCGQPSATLAW